MLSFPTRIVLSVILVLILFLIAIINIQIEKSIKRIISLTFNTDECIKLRRITKFARHISRGLILCVFIIGASLTLLAEEINTIHTAIFVAFITTTINQFKNDKLWSKLLGNISTLDKSTFYKNNDDYALYLRAFETDEYSTNDSTEVLFSENRFTSVLKIQMPIYAVGMTKELDSPNGAIRIYLKDDTWQNDVIELMKHASSIYILVSDRDSCLWEIEQSIPFANKTTYIVNDLKTYNNVRNRITDPQFLPEISHPTSNESGFYIRYNDDDTSIVSSFNYNEEGYCLLGGISNNYKPKQHIKFNNIVKGCYTFFLIVAASIIIFSLVFIIHDTLSENKEQPIEVQEVQDLRNFIFIYQDDNNSVTYVSQGIDETTKLDFHTFLSSMSAQILDSGKVFILYDGNPQTYVSIRKAIKYNINHKCHIRMLDYLEIISWLKFKDYKGAAGVTYKNRCCITDSEDGLVEVISCGAISYNNISDIDYVVNISSRDELIGLVSTACVEYANILGSNDSGTLLLNTLPFDIYLYGTKLIDANVSLPYRRLTSLNYDGFSYLSFELKSQDSRHSQNISIPITAPAGQYVFIVDVDHLGNISVSLLEVETLTPLLYDTFDNYI